MLPFPKRVKSDEIELGDDDILVVEGADDAIAVDVDIDDVELAPAPATGPRMKLPAVTAPPAKPMRPRLVSTPAFEDDVADQCLATIAAETSRTRLSDRFPASIVPPPARLPKAPPLPSFDEDVIATSRLPVVTAPPPRVHASVPYSRDSVPGVAAAPSGPAPAFVRTSSASLPAVVPSSVAPVSLSAAPEPTVIVVQQPPRTAWIVASAVVGAACALGAMQLLAKGGDPPPAPVVASPAPPPPVASPVVAAHTAAPAVVKFREEQGLAIVAPAVVPAAPSAPAPAAAPAPHVVHAPAPAVKPAPAPAPVAAAPAKTSTAAKLGPKLPDGSVALGARVDPPPAPTSATSAPPPPATGAKKKLSPEQELAEAQLKASMK